MRLKYGTSLSFVLLLFFGSGIAALLYQTIWQRMLGFFSGVDVYSVTITVAAFMAGLGCGSLTGGHLADRLSARHRLLVFVIAEAIMMLFALGSKWLYYDLLYLRWNGLADSPVLLPVILFLSMLCPTFCMGMTLPILAKTFTGKIEAASAVVGYLYGVNTLGAATGALLTPWLLMRHFSFPDILRLGAALNAICAIGATLIWWWSDPKLLPAAAETAQEDTDVSATSHFPARVWMLIYGLSGFIALSLEIVWFRLLGVIQKSTSFTFPTLLAVYLTGLGLGVLVGAPLARRIRRPAVAFLAFQSAITLYAAIAFAALVGQVDHKNFLQPLWVYLGSYNPVAAADLLNAIRLWFSGQTLSPELSQSAGLVVLLYFILPFVLIAPSTFLMGLSFPILQRLVQNNPLLLGRRVGWLQTFNIAGSLLGALLVGWCFLDWFGSAGTFKLLVVLGGIFLCLIPLHVAERRWFRIAGVIAAVLCVSAITAGLQPLQKLWAKLHGAQPRAIIAREGASGLALLKGNPDHFNQDVVWVFNNGLGQSWLPYGSIHTQIGLLAALVHPSPQEVAIIGLGSGDTVFAVGGSPHTRQITCVEIVKPSHEVLQQLAGRLPYPALVALLQDSRIQWLFTDGRAYILRSGKQFDVIEADALRSNSAYSGNVYSYEYFQALKAHLKPGGLAVTWLPTGRVRSTFLEVFPYAIEVNGIALGSREPIAVEPEAILRRIADPFTVAYYKRIETDLTPLLTDLLAGKFTRYSPEIRRRARPDLNFDLFPRDEFMVPES